MSEASSVEALPTAEGVTTRRSPFTVAETLQRLEAAMQAHNLTVFARIDHSDAAKQIGLSMQEAHVLIFGNPKSGTPVMVASPLLALDLPLKALVWQSRDGRVWVSTTSAAYLQARYAIPQELIGNIAGAEPLIEHVLQDEPRTKA